MVIFIKKVSESQLVKAGTTLGVDEIFLAMKESKNHKKVNVMKAVLGKKHIKFKKPLIQWEQQYQKLKL
jgi:hypothetical protein